ncbi:hypothetical protein AUJ14_04510 [Candidatus Micrarchaeota archaeon CG1_02_55_22]|nr:MAG: hypothetical protein AUJ14_04510 [Candidatus Micrarchaeota archaeon CG1_02_55_22]
MNRMQYDEDSDSLYVTISAKPAYLTAEISPRIGVDVTAEGRPVGVEILEASKVVSDLLQRKVERSEVKRLLCRINEDDAIYLNFTLGSEHAALALPKAYKSPIL